MPPMWNYVNQMPPMHSAIRAIQPDAIKTANSKPANQNLAALDLRHPWWFAKVKIWQIKNSLSAEFERISIPQKVCISYCYIQAGACRNICTILKALHLHHLASIHNEKGTERRDGPGQLQFALLQLVLLNMLLLPNDKSRFHGWSLACCRCLHFYTQLSWQSIKRNSSLSWGLKRTSAAISKMRQKHAKITITQVFGKYITVYQFIRLSVYLSIHPSNLSDPYLWDWNSWSPLRFRGFPASTIEAGWITGSGFHGAGNAANGKLCRVYAEAPRKADKMNEKYTKI